MDQDIFLRAHTVTPRKPQRKAERVRKWPDRVLVFDTETTIDTGQNLTFGAYRLCDLVDGKYICSQEGLLYADNLDLRQRKLLQAYISRSLADIETKSFPPKLELKLLPRWQFVEKVLWRGIKEGRMIVGFNLPFDLSRLAVDWRTARNGGWSLIMSIRRSRKTGQMEPNPDRPRIRITSKDSKSAFIALMRPRISDEWPKGRFLDLHTLAFALLGESHGLDSFCEKFNVPGKVKYEPSGKVSPAEITYCRQDVRATTDLLNALRQEFDLHPIDLAPDRAYSAASIAKAYLDAMGIIPPNQKFKVTNRVHGIAMQAYYGGRAETRIRQVPVPVIHTDFKSEYPTVNALLGNWEVLTAERISVEDATKDVQRLLQKVGQDGTFNQEFWPELKFFALVQPDDDILPVRAVYNGETQNIGVNRLTSAEPIWFAGPDLIASVLLRGKAPRVKKALRIVPHGRQSGMRATNLRGMIPINPAKYDFFRRAVEQRDLHKSDKSLAHFLKVVANAGSYGLFVELTPEKQAKPVRIRVFSGPESFSQTSEVFENHGRWYFPPIAALITAGGRLLLAMLERCVGDAGGTYLFCDTDSLCITASERGGLVACPGGQHRLNDRQAIAALSRRDVHAITDRFAALNPYDIKIVRGSILKIEGVNFDSDGSPRRINGYAISAKRYSLYQLAGRDLMVIDPKAHGLGYLYPPKDKRSEGDPDWTDEAWDWLLREAHSLPRKAPCWLDFPAMMRVVLSTPHVLQRLNRSTRPYNFLFCPLIDTVAGYPEGVDPNHFTLIAPFTKKRERWLQAECTNVFDGRVYRLALEQTPKLDKVIPQTFGYVLRLYPCHPESKSLASDGTPCSATTRGLLQRASITAGRMRYVGKETDRRWEQGEDLSLMSFTPMEFQPGGKMAVADVSLLSEMATHPLRELMRKTGLSQHTLEAIRAGQAVRTRTLAILKQALRASTLP